MIHKHNESEHQAIINTMDNLQGIVDALWVEYGNGHSEQNPKLAKSLKILNKWSTKLSAQIDTHANNTVSYDTEVKNWRSAKKIGAWVLGIVATIIAAYVGKTFM